MITALNAGTAFMVPLRDSPPDVGYVPVTYVDPIQDEIAEIAAEHVAKFPTEPRLWFKALVVFGLAIVAMMQRRAAEDIPDLARPVAVAKAPVLTKEQESKLVAAHLGRILDWIGKGQLVANMGLRFLAVCSHIRAGAIDYRTNQEAADELGLSSRQAVNRVVSLFRRDLGADYPGESGKSTNTKNKCRKSRNTKLRGRK